MLLLLVFTGSICLADPGIQANVGDDGVEDESRCFQLCHVVKSQDIHDAYCTRRRDSGPCPDLHHRIDDCPKLAVAGTQDSTLPPVPGVNGSGGADHHNVTSAATGSDAGRRLAASAAAVTTVWLLVRELVGARVGGNAGLVEAVVAVLSPFWWLALTSLPYTCRGLT